jgi:putative endonuclease
MKVMYYFYILRSQVNQKLYLGYTNNLKKRIASHNTKNNRASKPYAPYDLLYYSAFKNQKDALECEKYFKTTAGWRRIKRMLKNSLL